MSIVWLVSVPNEGTRSSETTFLELKAETASTRHDYAGAPYRRGVSVHLCSKERLTRACVADDAECFRVDLPSDLLVGTLDSLMVRARIRAFQSII